MTVAMSQLYCIFLILLFQSLSIKAFDDYEEKVWIRISRRISHQLPVLVEDQLIDLLKYHRYDKMLSHGHKSEIERLNEGFHHMKGMMNQLNRRLQSVENINQVLSEEFKKSESYNQKLEKELDALSTWVNGIKRNLSTDAKGMCVCNPSLSGNHAQETSPTQSTKTISSPQYSSIVAVNSDGSDLVKVNLRNMKVTELKNTMVRRQVTATTYDPKSNSIIWSKGKPVGFWSHESAGPRIYSTPLDSLEEESQVHAAGASSMTVDTANNWLFFTTVRPRKSISRIRPTGGDFSQIHGMSEFLDLQDIAVDPQKELVYTCDGDNLIEVDYHGTQKKILVKGGFIVTLALGSRNSDLYFYDHDKLKKRHLETGNEVVVKANLDMIPKDLIYEDGKLYYGAFFQGTVRVLDLKTSAIKDIGSLEGSSISLCLVP